MGYIFRFILEKRVQETVFYYKFDQKFISFANIVSFLKINLWKTKDHII